MTTPVPVHCALRRAVCLADSGCSAAPVAGNGAVAPQECRTDFVNKHQVEQQVDRSRLQRRYHPVRSDQLRQDNRGSLRKHCFSALLRHHAHTTPPPPPPPPPSPALQKISRLDALGFEVSAVDRFEPPQPVTILVGHGSSGEFIKLLFLESVQDSARVRNEWYYGDIVNAAVGRDGKALCFKFINTDDHKMIMSLVGTLPTPVPMLGPQKYLDALTESTAVLPCKLSAATMAELWAFLSQRNITSATADAVRAYVNRRRLVKEKQREGQWAEDLQQWIAPAPPRQDAVSTATVTGDDSGSDGKVNACDTALVVASAAAVTGDAKDGSKKLSAPDTSLVVAASAATATKDDSGGGGEKRDDACDAALASGYEMVDGQ
ncbi:hypothetical protein JKP88DRAFT_248510 [Tribonema minus]|uniref:Uncharacterized protein n=1 Tax=Tribonema minus TaxID=303371 RepID=A0A836CB67_9STRA|nr:hypothetical protein JKP88DRAFT_248510 [Tribonema minus]